MQGHTSLSVMKKVTSYQLSATAVRACVGVLTVMVLSLQTHAGEIGLTAVSTTLKRIGFVLK